jgi:hypothetical protein
LEFEGFACVRERCISIDLMYKRLKSRWGKFFAGAYLCLIPLAIFAIFVGVHDGLGVLFLLLYLAWPWSFILFFRIGIPDSPLVAIALYVCCVFLNAVALYFVGSFVHWFATLENLPEKDDSEAPQD